MHLLAKIYYHFGLRSALKYAIRKPLLSAEDSMRLECYFIELNLNGGEDWGLQSKYSDLINLIK